MEATLKDYYKVLGVEKGASEKEIKTSYRKLARQHHPDTKASKDKVAAEERIKEINEAYGVLGDAKKRAEYDQLMAALKNPRRAGSGGFAPGAGFKPTSDGGYTFHWEGADGADGIDPSMFGDLFSDLFGNGRAGNFSDLFRGRETRRNPFAGTSAEPASRANRRAWSSEPASGSGANYESEVTLTIEEAYRGGTRTMRFSTDESDGGRTGSGSGQSSVRTLEVKIPPGVRDGSVIRLQGQGMKGYGGGPAGDLLMTIRLRPDKQFKLEGDDVETTLMLRPDQAALGCQIPVKTLEGRVRLTIPAMTRNGHRMRLQGKGWPRKKGGHGDLFVRIHIDLPEHLTEKELRLYRQLAEERKE